MTRDALTALTIDVVDMLVPEHSVLRYHATVACTDGNRLGGFAYPIDQKEWRCKRCCLLDMIDGEGPPDAVVTMNVEGCGNVK